MKTKNIIEYTIIPLVFVYLLIFSNISNGATKNTQEPNLSLKCKKLTTGLFTSHSNIIIRCENEEIICYTTYRAGQSCKFKETPQHIVNKST